MVRTQIQLTEAQTASLKKAAAKRRISMAEAIRRSVDLYLEKGDVGPEEMRKRALAISGKFRSKHADLALRHDRYLAEDLSKRPLSSTPPSSSPC